MGCNCGGRNRTMFQVVKTEEDGTVKVLNEFQQEPVAKRYADGVPGATVRPKP